MDATSRLTSGGPAPDGPRPHLILSHREERDQVEQAVGGADEAGQRGLRHAEVVEEGLLLVRRKSRDFRLDARRQDESRRLQRRDPVAQRLRHQLGDAPLVPVHGHQQRPVRQEDVVLQLTAIEIPGRNRSKRLAFLQDALHQVEVGHFLRRGLLLLRAGQAPLDDLEVGENALGVECLEIAERIGPPLDGRIVEVAQDEAERLLVADLLE